MVTGLISAGEIIHTPKGPSITYRVSILCAQQTVDHLVPIDRTHECGNLLILLVSDLLLVQGKRIH